MQDLYINKLTEKIRKLEEQLALQSAQLGAQAKEAEMARETLAEASKEMEVRSFFSFLLTRRVSHILRSNI